MSEYLTDDQMAEIKAAQTLALAKLQERTGMSNEQMARASAAIAAPKAI